MVQTRRGENAAWSSLAGPRSQRRGAVRLDRELIGRDDAQAGTSQLDRYTREVTLTVRADEFRRCTAKARRHGLENTRATAVIVHVVGDQDADRRPPEIAAGLGRRGYAAISRIRTTLRSRVWRKLQSLLHETTRFSLPRGALSERFHPQPASESGRRPGESRTWTARPGDRYMKLAKGVQPRPADRQTRNNS